MQLTWFAGVDWGFQKHQACVLDDAGRVLGEQEFEHGGAGLSEMANWLLSFAAGEAGEVGVAIETPRGPVVESLMERGFALHSINPKQLDRFRDRLSPAGAKDDRRDARTLAAALRTDPHCLRRLEPTDPVIVELREWSRLSEELTRERVRLANRMRDAPRRHLLRPAPRQDRHCVNSATQRPRASPSLYAQVRRESNRTPKRRLQNSGESFSSIRTPFGGSFLRYRNHRFLEAHQQASRAAREVIHVRCHLHQPPNSVLVQIAKGLGDNGIWRIAKLNGIPYLPDVGSKTTSFSSAFAGIFDSN